MSGISYKVPQSRTGKLRLISKVKSLYCACRNFVNWNICNRALNDLKLVCHKNLIIESYKRKKNRFSYLQQYYFLAAAKQLNKLPCIVNLPFTQHVSKHVYHFTTLPCLLPCMSPSMLPIMFYQACFLAIEIQSVSLSMDFYMWK